MVVTGGTFSVGNIALEGSFDGGTTWGTLRLIFEDSANGVCLDHKEVQLAVQLI